MEQAKALAQLIETVDLLGMVEVLTNNSNLNAVSASSWSGIRITLRNIKAQILESHDALARDLVARAKTDNAVASAQTTSITELDQNGMPRLPNALRASAPQAVGPKMERRDLRASLERVVDR